MTGRDAPGLRHGYAQALRASVGVNASAYGYSVMITVSFAMLAGALGSPDRLDGFLFVFGAAASFASMEFIATRRFRKRVRGEPPSVVVLGSAMSFASMASASASPCSSACGTPNSHGRWGPTLPAPPICLSGLWNYYSAGAPKSVEASKARDS